MTRRVAIVQSNYIPWKGYFDLMHRVDEFILFDDMQFTRRDWRNRNKIKTPQGLHWLTIPVEVKGKYYQAIKDTVISDPGWTKDHWRTIQQHYAKAPHFRDYKELFEALYLETTDTYLSAINYRFLTALCKILDIQTKISWSMDYRIVDGKTERLVSLCQQAGANDYISGPSAKDYIDPTLFAAAGITLTFMDYSRYPSHPQLYPPFEHGVSILDLVFNVGAQVGPYMLSVGSQTT
ncbi:MAG: WbqC family protein [Chloroflexota bacterium]